MNKKITKMPKTAEEFYEYHQILWDEIVKAIDCNLGIFDSDFFEFKKDIARKIFGKKIIALLSNVNFCFPCLWCNIKCTNCLLKTNNIAAPQCLDLTYYNFNEALNSYQTKKSIKLAKKIRDWPMDERWCQVEHERIYWKKNIRKYL